MGTVLLDYFRQRPNVAHSTMPNVRKQVPRLLSLQSACIFFSLLLVVQQNKKTLVLIEIHPVLFSGSTHRIRPLVLYAERSFNPFLQNHPLRSLLSFLLWLCVIVFKELEFISFIPCFQIGVSINFS